MAAFLLRHSSRLSLALSRSVKPATPGSGILLQDSQILQPFLVAPAFSAQPFSSDSFIEVPSSALPSWSFKRYPWSYRTNVGICLFNSSDKVFAVSSLDRGDVWQMPQDVIDGEPANNRAVALRKLEEETGVRSVRFMAMAWLQADDTFETIPALGGEEPMVLVRKDWKTRAHKWLYFRFTGKDDEIHLRADGKEKPRFGKWAWMSPDELMERTLDSNKPVYEEAFETFSKFIFVKAGP